jgi:ribokinase
MSTPNPFAPPGDPSAGGVLIVGSVTADLTTFSTALPRPGETILGDDFTLVLGGKGANQAVAAGLAGAASHFVACVGTDLFSDLVTTGLRDAGVHLEHVRAVAGPTGIAHIRVDASGENDIVMVPLANASLSEAHVDEAIAALDGRVSVLLTQLEIPWRISEHAIRASRAAGLTIVLDPAPATTLSDELWPLIDIVTPNETEATLITGIPVVDRASAIAAAGWFVERGTRAALITLASAGAILVTARGAENNPVPGSLSVTSFAAFPVTAIDTTAAGDAFAGYLGAGLAAGLELPAAIERAMAAGAIAVTVRGASPSLPTAEAVDRLLAENVGKTQPHTTAFEPELRSIK